VAEGTTEARVFVLAGPDFARSFPLRERSTLGRADECDVVLRDRSISRKHAVLVREGEQWFVQDLGSTNGVSKDGKRGERFELADGDEFKLGDLPLRLRLTAAAAEEIEFESSAPAAAVAPSPARPAEPARASCRPPSSARRARRAAPGSSRPISDSSRSGCAASSRSPCSSSARVSRTAPFAR